MFASYTLSQANALLPLLRAVGREVLEELEERRQVERTQADLELAVARTAEGLEGALGELRLRGLEIEARLRSCRRELEGLGLAVQRLDPLTVHIPGRTLSGRLVFCWEQGEKLILHGHEPGEEDEPRRPLQIVTR